MTRALLFSLLLTAAASAQVVVLPDAQAGPEPAPILGLSGLDCSAGASAAVAAPGALPPAPMTLFGTTSGATIPNVCRDAAPLAVLPPGVQFRTDPLPRDTRYGLGRQWLREQENELFRNAPPYDPRFDVRRFRPQIYLPQFERMEREPMVAPPGHRP